MDGKFDGVRFPVAAPPPAGEVLLIAEGVWWLRMPLPFALDHINLWLLEDGPGWTIVDAGYALPETRAAWERILAEHLAGRPVTRVIVTHYHPDHIGLAGWLCERWRAPLWITEKEWLYARVMSRGSDDFGALRRGFAHRAGLDSAASELFGTREKSYRRGVPTVPPAFNRLTEGMTIEIGGRQWRVIVGEGHAPELACLYCAETGVLISADQVLPKISPNVSVQPHEPVGDPLALYLASLERLRAAVPSETLVLPSHNLPFFGLHMRIDELAAHHAARCDELLASLDRPKSAVDVLPVLFRRPLDAPSDGVRARRGACPFALSRSSACARPRIRRGRSRPLCRRVEIISGRHIPVVDRGQGSSGGSRRWTSMRGRMPSRRGSSNEVGRRA